MKKIIVLLTASFVAATFVSCNDEFLEKTPLDKLSEDAVFNSDGLAESYVNALYGVLSDPFQEANIGAISDEGFFRYGGSSTRYIADGSLNPDNTMYIEEGGSAHNTRCTILNIWNKSYKFIRNMNDFLDKVPASDHMTAAVKNRLIGEVYFLRAWAYTNLIERYAGVPIITDTYELSDKFGVTRDSFDDCVDFILGDLDKAYELLPAKEDAIKGRANKDFALALRSRLTLIAASPLFNDPENPEGGIFRGAYSHDKWKRALDASKAIVDRADVDGAYALATNYSDYWIDPECNENIWCKYFPAAGYQNKAQLLYSVVYFNGWTSLDPCQALIMDYEMSNGKKWFEEGSGYDPAHPFNNRDPRFYHHICEPFCIYGNTDNSGYHENVLELYLLYEGKTLADFAGSVDKEPTWDSKSKHLWNATNNSGYELRKWYNPLVPIAESETGSKFYPWFRLAEFYLNYAECAFMTGDEATCRTYINKIRQRVGMPAVTEGGESLWDRLVNERRIELAFEAFRYFDVRRWKVADFYENIPFAGLRTMILHEKGNQYDTIYRMPTIYDPAAEKMIWYKDNVANFIDNPNLAHKLKPYYTYKWLGKEYNIDFMNCTLGFSPTQKYFPEDGRMYLMPIPRNEITKSEHSIIQNPGYN